MGIVTRERRAEFIDIGLHEFHLQITEDWKTGGMILRNLNTDKTIRISLRELEDTHDMNALIKGKCKEIATEHTPRTKWNCTNHGSPIPETKSIQNR